MGTDSKANKETRGKQHSMQWDTTKIVAIIGSDARIDSEIL
jgi:hypothetical protein